MEGCRNVATMHGLSALCVGIIMEGIVIDLVVLLCTR